MENISKCSLRHAEKGLWWLSQGVRKWVPEIIRHPDHHSWKTEIMIMLVKSRKCFENLFCMGIVTCIISFNSHGNSVGVGIIPILQKKKLR